MEDPREERMRQEVEEAFHRIAGEDQKINLSELKAAMGMQESFFVERYFKYFDSDGSGTIELSEFKLSLEKLSKQTDTEKLKFLFDLFDTSGDGTISFEELETVLHACVGESELEISQEQLQMLTEALFRAADVDCSGSISFEEIKTEFEKYPDVLEHLTISPYVWLRPKTRKQSTIGTKLKATCGNYCSAKYLRANVPYVVFCAIFTFINVGLFILSAVLYRSKNGYVIVARGCGMALNFDCAFVPVLMLRRCLSWLRTTPLHKVLPLDDSIFIHKIVGYTIVVFSVIHTVMHFANIGVLSARSGAYAYWQYLFTRTPNIGWIAGFAPLSGLILDVILILMVVGSLNFIREKGYFQVFYWTHLLYVPFWVLLFLHGPRFWMFFCLPLLLFLTEKAIQLYWFIKQLSAGTYIKEVQLLPSTVTQLVIDRPPGFNFKAGDYVFIQIPDLAAFEWHPFTLSSSPEQNDILQVHIRGLGNWTRKAHSYFLKETYLLHSEKYKKRTKKSAVDVESPIRNDVTNNQGIGWRRNLEIKVFVDGPYGTPARHIPEAEHAVLVSTGIGVTPFASILQSLVIQYKQSLAAKSTASVGEGTVEPTKLFQREDSQIIPFKLKKVDFIWINRDIKSFEWFVTLLTSLELEEAKEKKFDKFLDIHMYMTRAKAKTDLQGLGLQMALELVYQKENKDLLTGLKTRLQPGRPNWNQLFRQFAEETKGRVHIFYCGPPALADTLRKMCREWNFEFSKETF